MRTSRRTTHRRFNLSPLRTAAAVSSARMSTLVTIPYGRSAWSTNACVSCVGAERRAHSTNCARRCEGKKPRGGPKQHGRVRSRARNRPQRACYASESRREVGTPEPRALWAASLHTSAHDRPTSARHIAMARGREPADPVVYRRSRVQRVLSVLGASQFGTEGVLEYSHAGGRSACSTSHPWTALWYGFGLYLRQSLQWSTPRVPCE